MTVKVFGVGAVFGRIGKESTPIEFGFFNEIEQLIVVFFGFTWIPNDEVAAEGRIWFTFANIGDAIQETLTVSPTTHATQKWLADMLQRKVEIRHTRLADGINEAIT